MKISWSEGELVIELAENETYGTTSIDFTGHSYTRFNIRHIKEIEVDKSLLVLPTSSILLLVTGSAPK